MNAKQTLALAVIAGMGLTASLTACGSNKTSTQSIPAVSQPAAKPTTAAPATPVKAAPVSPCDAFNGQASAFESAVANPSTATTAFSTFEAQLSTDAKNSSGDVSAEFSAVSAVVSGTQAIDGNTVSASDLATMKSTDSDVSAMCALS